MLSLLLTQVKIREVLPAFIDLCLLGPCKFKAFPSTFLPLPERVGQLLGIDGAVTSWIGGINFGIERPFLLEDSLALANSPEKKQDQNEIHDVLFHSNSRRK